jgi:Ca2+-binding RTX toxin-like protein
MNQSPRAVAEQLESRRLMDGTATLAAGVLTITGTDRNDVIVVGLDRKDATRLDVRINHISQAFDLEMIGSVVVDAGAGNDVVLVSERGGRLFLPFKVDAGAGNDIVATGSGNDVIVGGTGNDKLSGGAGDDQIDGGDGNDKLVGGADNDLILGDGGRDKLVGDAGNDNLDGGDGKDAITPGAGEDEVAADARNTGEVHDRKVNRNGDGQYVVGDPATLSADLLALHEQVVPGSHVVRVEMLDGKVALYYHFGDDPKVYKTVVDVTTPEVFLVTREISPQEVRDPARAAFTARFPNAEVLSVFQHSHGTDDIRYRDADGSIKQVSTDDLIWTLDDAENDANNDGVDDHHGSTDGQGGNQNGGDPTQGPIDQGGLDNQGLPTDGTPSTPPAGGGTDDTQPRT